MIVKASCLTCEPSYMIVPNLARTCDGLAIGTVRVIVQLPVKRVYLIGSVPLDNTMRPRIGDQWGEWCAEM